MSSSEEVSPKLQVKDQESSSSGGSTGASESQADCSAQEEEVSSLSSSPSSNGNVSSGSTGLESSGDSRPQVEEEVSSLFPKLQQESSSSSGGSGSSSSLEPSGDSRPSVSEPQRWLPPGLLPPAPWYSDIKEPRLPGLLCLCCKSRMYTYYPSWKEIPKTAPWGLVLESLNGNKELARLGVRTYKREIREWYRLSQVFCHHVGAVESLIEHHAELMERMAVRTVGMMLEGCYDNGPDHYFDYAADVCKLLGKGRLFIRGICSAAEYDSDEEEGTGEGPIWHGRGEEGTEEGQEEDD